MDAKGGMDGEGKAEPLAEAGQFGDTGFGLVAEAEVAALVKAGDTQGVAQDPLDELAGGEAGKGLVELEDDDGVDSCFGQQGDAVFHRGEQAGGRFRTEKLLRVRVKGDGNRFHAAPPGVCDNGAEDLAVAKVDSVEVADGGDGGAEVLRDLADSMVDGDHARPPWSASRFTETSR